MQKGSKGMNTIQRSELSLINVKGKTSLINYSCWPGLSGKTTIISAPGIACKTANMSLCVDGVTLQTEAENSLSSLQALGCCEICL